MSKIMTLNGKSKFYNFFVDLYNRNKRILIVSVFIFFIQAVFILLMFVNIYSNNLWQLAIVCPSSIGVSSPQG